MATWRAAVSVSHGALGGTGSNTWHLRTPVEVFNAIDANTLLGVIETFYTDVASVIGTGTTIRFDGTLIGVGASDGEFQEIDPWTVVGASNSAILPPANCVCFNWGGQSGDRSKRGRTFLGPIGRAAAGDDGTIEDATLTFLRLKAANLVSASAGLGNGAVGIWSRQEQVFRDVVDSAVSDQFAVLRSRRD